MTNTPPEPDILFEPLRFPHLTVKNRIFRSNITGRFDNYDGSGTQARIAWETKFARGGVGAILSSFVPVHVRGRVQPNYATIDRDDKIPFWREVASSESTNTTASSYCSSVIPAVNGTFRASRTS